MASFELALNHVLKQEVDKDGNRISENKHDRGGLTNSGISLRFLKNIPADRLARYGIFEEPNEDTIRNLRAEQIANIYQGEFWDHATFEKIQNQNICNYVFDMAVNMGISPAIKCLQRACWAAWGDKNILVEDGILGQKTLNLINQSWSHWQDILSAMRSERAGTYKLIACHSPMQIEFMDGWLNRAYGISAKEMEQSLKAS